MSEITKRARFLVEIGRYGITSDDIADIVGTSREKILDTFTNTCRFKPCISLEDIDMCGLKCEIKKGVAFFELRAAIYFLIRYNSPLSREALAAYFRKLRTFKMLI